MPKHPQTLHVSVRNEKNRAAGKICKVCSRKTFVDEPSTRLSKVPPPPAAEVHFSVAGTEQSAMTSIA